MQITPAPAEKKKAIPREQNLQQLPSSVFLQHLQGQQQDVQ
jgi:hypothetical protein